MNESPKTRHSLIARLQDWEDAEAWAEFVQIYQPLIRTFVRRRGLQDADAADVAQAVLSRVSSAIANWNPDPAKGTFRAWLYRVTRNLTVDYLRRNRPLPGTDEKVDLDQIPAPGHDDSRDFWLEYQRRLFNWAAAHVRPSFKPQNWEAFWLSTIEGRPVGEVAETLQIPKATVYVIRSRVMARISSVIRQRMDEEPPLNPVAHKNEGKTDDPC